MLCRPRSVSSVKSLWGSDAGPPVTPWPQTRPAQEIERVAESWPLVDCVVCVCVCVCMDVCTTRMPVFVCARTQVLFRTPGTLAKFTPPHQQPSACTPPTLLMQRVHGSTEVTSPQDTQVSHAAQSAGAMTARNGLLDSNTSCASWLSPVCATGSRALTKSTKSRILTRNSYLAAVYTELLAHAPHDSGHLPIACDTA